MSLIETTGDIFSYVGTHKIIIPTNQYGVMGAGLALQAKQKYPDIQKYYQKFLHTTNDTRTPWYHDEFPDLILAPTKRHWSEKSNIDDIAAVLLALSKIEGGPFAIPEMGCGLGGLTWSHTKNLYHPFESTKTEWVVVHPPKVKMYTGILR